ncbi:MAG: 2OG-Fe(II) oxygenase [Microcoleaceae cyanobacterium]
MDSLTALDEKFQHIIGESLAIIEAALKQPELSFKERSDLALKVLAIAQMNSQPEAPGKPFLSALQALSEHLSEDLTRQQIDSSCGSALEVVTPRVVQVDHFLSPEEHQMTLEVALSHQADFFEAGTFSKAKDYRQSLVLLVNHLPDFYNLIRQKLLEVRPMVLEKLDLPDFLVSLVEMQITAHNHGGFYRIHNDVDRQKAANRTLSYIYYFYQEPKAFYGGELRLYKTQIHGDRAAIQEDFEMIEPRNNSVVFFDSRCKHEVLPVVCPSGKFEHSRFTINGWIRC